MKIKINGIELQGKICDLILSMLPNKLPRGELHVSQEFIQDLQFMLGQYSEPRTPDATPEEIKDWDEARKMLNKFDFYKSRQKVTFVEWDSELLKDVPCEDPNERRKKQYLADPFDFNHWH